MHKSFALLLAFSFFLACSENKKPEAAKQPAPLPASPIPVYEDFSLLEPILHLQNDTTYVLNFWATTCKPCLQEMPHFEHLNKMYANKKIRILLVSLDLKRHAQTRVAKFIEKKNIQNEVVVMCDQNYSKWTGKIDGSWYGALPATLIYKNKKRSFFFGAFETYEDLDKAVAAVMR
ncbi:MAG TPA: redoxin domain-containing protein [Bacteroidetes bacterium]|nr:redoxin domain-containing protein [Bacteroidota bacterium]